MPSLKDSPPEEKAKRLREIADGLGNPADAAMVILYASEVEAAAWKKRRRWDLRPRKDQPER